jgi:hypothetical protein
MLIINGDSINRFTRLATPKSFFGAFFPKSPVNIG